MNHRTSTFPRRTLRAYVAALVTYVMLVGQVAPLALAAPRAAAHAPRGSAAPPAAERVAARPAPAPLPFFAPGVTATKVDSWDDTLTPDGKAEPGQTITYTVTVTNAGPDPATGVTFTDNVDPNTTLVTNSVQTQPIAQPDAVSAFGNVRISTAAGAPNLLANDYDPDTAGNTGLTASGPTTSTNGGEVTVSSDGAFSYNPAPGFTGSDTFTYTVTDAQGKTDTAVVNITVGPTLVWFINNDPAAPPGNDGRITSPFNSIASYNASAPTKDPNDIVFIYQGTAAYSGNLTLTSGMKLIGQGFSLQAETGAPPAGSEALPPATANPVINSAAGNTVTLNQNNTVRGLTLNNSAGIDITGSGFGTLTVSNVTLAGTGRPLSLTNGTLAAAFDSITATSATGGQGILLSSVGGSLTSAGGTSITGATTQGVLVTGSTVSANFGATTISGGTDGVSLQNNSSGTRTFGSLTVSGNTAAGFLHGAGGGATTVTGATSITNPGGAGIDIQSSNAAVSFAATTVGKNNAGTAVNLSNNGSNTTSFSSLAITASSGAGLVASAGGSLTVTTGSITATGTGVAASLTNTTLNLTFTSVSSNNGANGIIISGGSGSFTSGTTSLTNNAGIGLSMSSSAVAANFGNTNVGSSAGDAVDLASNSGAITFADLDMTPDAGLRGLDAVGNTGAITVTSGDVTTSGGATAAAVFVDGPAGRTPINLTFTSVTTTGVGNATSVGSITLIETSGTKFQVTGTTQINTRAGHGVFVDNSTPTTIQFAAVNAANPTAAGGDGIHVEDSSSAVTVATAAISDANQVTAQADGDNNGFPENDGDGNAIFLRGNTGSFTLNGGTLSNCGNDCIDVRNSANLVISGVTINTPGVDANGALSSGTGGHGIQALNLTGTNSITSSTITNWETAARDGLRWWNNLAGTGTMTVHGTTFSNSENGSNAILYQGDSSAVMTLNVGGAAAGQPCTFSQVFGAAITHNAGVNAGSTATANLNVTNNTFSGTPNGGQNSVGSRNVAGGKAVVVITGNTFDNVGRTLADTSGVIDLGGDGAEAGNFISFTVTNNIIRNIGVTTACLSPASALECHGKRGIDVFIDDNTVIGNDANAAIDADDAIVISGNVITNMQRSGIIFDVGQVFNGSNFQAKVTNNRVGIRADNTIDRVGQGDALAAGGEWSMLVENRNENAKDLNILISNNLFYNGNGGAGSATNNSGMLFRAQRTATLTGTVTNNTFNVNTSSASYGVNVGTVNTGTPFVCFDATGNTIAAPAGGFGLVEVVGDLNVEQASAAALSAANGGATVTTVVGTPDFGVACAAPPAGPVTFEAAQAVAPVAVGATDTTATGEAASKSAFDGGLTSRPFVTFPRTANAPAQTAAGANAAAAQPRSDAAVRAAGVRKPAAGSDEANATGASGKTRNINVSTLDPGVTKGAGGTVSVNIGTLNPGDSVTITFQAVIDAQYSGPPNVSNQGTVSGSNFSNVLTDDPSVGGASDPTLTPINSVSIAVNDAEESEPASGERKMLFVVALSPAPTAGVSVQFATTDGTATGGASCDGTADYVTTSGTLNLGAAQQTGIVEVTVCADNTGGETDETLTLTLSNPSGGNIVDGTATGTITQGTTPGTFLISELRTFGPGGSNDPNDEFVELYNNTDAPLTVAATDASAGYGVYAMGADCNAAPVLLGVIPNGTVIPARGHYLMTGSAYSLANYGGTGAAAGDLTMAADIPSNGNVGVFSTGNLANVSSANRLDAVGFGSNTGAVCSLLSEGATLAPAATNQTSLGQYTYFRKECDFVGGLGCQAGGNPKDSNENAADLLFADPNGTNAGAGERNGAAGPQNMASPIRRDTSGISTPLLDGTVSPSSAPNRVRDLTPGPAATSTFGTLSIRRRVQNNTGAPVTRLRFRIVEVTTFSSPAGTADLRARTSTPIVVATINDATTCASTGTPTSAPCSVTVQGTTLEEPPAQPNGGGYNSTLAAGTITTGTPLANGASVNVQFLLGVQQTGSFRFYIIIEALP